MIPVRTVGEPAAFDQKVRRPGNRWLAQNHNSQKRPPAYWSEFTPVLAKGYQDLCGYAAMLVLHDGTVDHFLSYKNHPDLTYEWANYRFASAVMNSIKRNKDDAILDPLEVGEDWFEILLPSLILKATNAVPVALREKAEYTLNALKLRSGATAIRWRQAWYDLYVEGKLTLDGLRQAAPLIAAAVEVERDQAMTHRGRRAR